MFVARATMKPNFIRMNHSQSLDVQVSKSIPDLPATSRRQFQNKVSVRCSIHMKFESIFMRTKCK